ncbi:uncharacterized protein FMAN_11102 [Fusarium mangiferae]|uniref:Uncharacterized protein n=1 Tax=Fusarium mangiferae TaxID=192010 RepID=A0A1L7TKU7_FUSMA|nr:uncharacterized protein FMAN_11102 [Fusarium mangiferae]CVK96773.1 uncharacterized protein FMAN_11102 [Fusarium mangiferae]
MSNRDYINVTPGNFTIEDMLRQMRRPIIFNQNGLMLPGDASTLKKVPELKAIGITVGGVLCGLRFESPSGETGNMVAPSNLAENAIIYQGDDAGERPAIEGSGLLHRSQTKIGSMPLRITNKGRMECKLPDGYRRVELKLSFVEKSEINVRHGEGIQIVTCADEKEKVNILFSWDDDILGENNTKALMFEEVVDGGEGTGACWILERGME